MDPVSKTTLLRLNDDCLQILLQYLELVEHIQLFSTCERLKICVQNYYYGKKIVFSKSIWKHCRNGNFDFLREFMKCVGPELRNLEIISLPLSDIRLFRSLPLTKVTKCLGYPYSRYILNQEEVNDLNEALKMISDNLECFGLVTEYLLTEIRGSIIFPKVTRLFAHGDFYNLQRIARMFPNLKILDLTLANIENFSSSLELKNLIQLTLLPDPTLPPNFIKEILSSLPLKRLTLQCDGIGFPYLQGLSKCQTIEEISFINFCGNHVSINDLHKLKLLRKINFMTSDEKIFPLSDIPEILNLEWNTLILSPFLIGFQSNENFSYNLKNVRRLFYGHEDGCSGWEQILDKVLALFTFCENLELFDFSEMCCDIKFLEKILNICRNNFGNRHKPLIIRFYETNILEKDAKNLDLPHFVKLSLKNRNYRLDKPGVYCNWIRK